MYSILIDNDRPETKLLTEEEKERFIVKTCPVHRNLRTKMPKRAFRRLCKAYQSKATKIHVCNDCITGENISEDRPFRKPNNIQWTD